MSLQKTASDIAAKILHDRADELAAKYDLDPGETLTYVYLDEDRAEAACEIAVLGCRVKDIKSALLFSGRETYKTASELKGWISYQRILRLHRT